MDRFFIGQKVRIIKAKYYPETIGMICTITGNREYRINEHTGESWLGYSVDLPKVMNDAGIATICPLEEVLEPVDDTNDKTSWSECAWKPSHLRESA